MWAKIELINSNARRDIGCYLITHFLFSQTARVTGALIECVDARGDTAHRPDQLRAAIVTMRIVPPVIRICLPLAFPALDRAPQAVVRRRVRHWLPLLASLFNFAV